VIVPSFHESAAITPCGNNVGHSVISPGSCAAVLQTIASRRQPIQRVVLSARGDASAPARSPFVHTVICAAWVFFCSGAPFEGSARAEPASIGSPRSALPFTAFVAEASKRFSIPANWIRAVMRVESVGDPRAVSPKGAMGLMQIMPKTYVGLRARHHLGPDAYSPRDNILAGAAYLREMLDRYGSPGFLAAYNAGPARYDEHLATGRSLPPETQLYVAMLSLMVGGRQSDDRTVASFDLIAWARAKLFATHPETDRRIGCRQNAAGSFARHLSHCRSLGALAAVGGSVRAPRQRDSSAMIEIAFHRTLAEFLARSVVGLNRWRRDDGYEAPTRRPWTAR
jgi:hypothetical protein